jgi:hypothetical protein
MEKCAKIYKNNLGFKLEIAELTGALEMKEKIIRDKTAQISVLQDKLENIAVKGVMKSTITNKVTNNIKFPLTKEWLNSNVKHLTENHIKDGIAGLARYAVDYPLKDRVVVTDLARKIMKFKNEEGDIVRDFKGRKTAQLVCESIRTPVQETVSKIVSDKLDFVAKPEVGKETAQVIMEQINEMCTMKSGVQHLAEGKEHQIQGPFTDGICECINPVNNL